MDERVARPRQQKKEEAKSESFDIKSLDDNLLLEVFLRIRDCRSAIRCSAVCKLWSSLILSNPKFISGYVHQQLSARSAAATPTPFTLLVQTVWQRAAIRYAQSTSADHLSLLPEPVKARASFDDLLLLITATTESLSPMRGKSFYVSNQLTGRWLKLPLPPQLPESETDIRFCLACEQPAEISDKLGLEFSDAPQEYCRFRAVLIYFDSYPRISPSGDYKFRASIFRSETGGWSRCVVLSPRELSTFGANGNHSAILGGTIYSLDGEYGASAKYITAFSPFRDEDGSKIRCRVIELPSDLNPLWASRPQLCLGVCRGRLRVSQLVPCEERHVYVISIWELRISDDSGGESAATETWELERRAVLRTGTTKEVSMVALHPDKGDLVFLLWDNSILRRHHILRETFRDVCEFRRESNMPNVFQIIHPPWTTPIPVLPSSY